MTRMKKLVATIFTLSAFSVGLAFATSIGVGSSTAQAFNDAGVQLTNGELSCIVKCKWFLPGEWLVIEQNAQWNNGSVGLAAGAAGRIAVEQNGGGTFDVEITLPSDLTLNGVLYERTSDMVLDGVVDAWPVGTNEYVLRDRVEFTNGIEVLHIEAGNVLTLEVQ